MKSEYRPVPRSHRGFGGCAPSFESTGELAGIHVDRLRPSHWMGCWRWAETILKFRRYLGSDWPGEVSLYIRLMTPDDVSNPSFIYIRKYILFLLPHHFLIAPHLLSSPDPAASGHPYFIGEPGRENDPFISKREEGERNLCKCTGRSRRLPFRIKQIKLLPSTEASSDMFLRTPSPEVGV